MDRDLHHAAILSPIVNISLNGFKSTFSKEMDNGSLVIIGWCHGPEGKNNVTGLMVGGEDKQLLLDLIGRVNTFKTHGFTTIAVA